MRILLATDNYPPIIGGGQIQSQMLARSIRERGHEVVVATVWQYGTPTVEYDDGVQVHRLRQLRTLPLVARARRQHQPPFPDPVTTLALRRLIRRFRPDVIHSYGWFSYSCAAALLGSRIPLVLTARDYAYCCAKRTLMYHGGVCSGPSLAKCLGCAPEEYGRLKGWITTIGVLGSAPLLRRKARAVHSISAYVESIMRRDFVASSDGGAQPLIHVTINDMNAGHELRDVDEQDCEARLAELPAEPFILYVGGFRRIKGLIQLFEAYDRLQDPPPLVLIGTFERDSPDVPSGVHVLTDLPHTAVMEAWRRCEFAVLPSSFPEPFGTVVVEAMSQGKAVIGTVPGGHADIIVDGESGILVPAGDVTALADAMTRLIADPDLRRHLGQAARERAKLFTVEQTLPRIERLYERLVQPPASVESGVT